MYIYRERERNKCVCVYVYIYIYISTILPERKLLFKTYVLPQGCFARYFLTNSCVCLKLLACGIVRS